MLASATMTPAPLCVPIFSIHCGLKGIARTALGRCMALSRMGQQDFYSSRKKLAEDLECSEGSAFSALNKLAKEGYILKTGINDHGCNTYRINVQHPAISAALAGERYRDALEGLEKGPVVRNKAHNKQKESNLGKVYREDRAMSSTFCKNFSSSEMPWWDDDFDYPDCPESGVITHYDDPVAPMPQPQPQPDPAPYTHDVYQQAPSEPAKPKFDIALDEMLEGVKFGQITDVEAYIKQHGLDPVKAHAYLDAYYDPSMTPNDYYLELLHGSNWREKAGRTYGVGVKPKTNSNQVKNYTAKNYADEKPGSAVEDLKKQLDNALDAKAPCTDFIQPPVQKLDTPCTKIEQGGVQNLYTKKNIQDLNKSNRGGGVVISKISDLKSKIAGQQKIPTPTPTPQGQGFKAQSSAVSREAKAPSVPVQCASKISEGYPRENAYIHQPTKPSVKPISEPAIKQGVRMAPVNPLFGREPHVVPTSNPVPAPGRYPASEQEAHAYFEYLFRRIEGRDGRVDGFEVLLPLAADKFLSYYNARGWEGVIDWRLKASNWLTGDIAKYRRDSAGYKDRLAGLKQDHIQESIDRRAERLYEEGGLFNSTEAKIALIFGTQNQQLN